MKNEIAYEFAQATTSDITLVVDLYRYTINTVNKSTVKLGWNIEKYPDITFVTETTERGEMYILRDGQEIIAAAVVNHNVNEEYNDIDWIVDDPAEKIATIHALTVSPDYRGKEISSFFLEKLHEVCRQQGDVSIHLDVIDTNIPAYKLYERAGYDERACIKMYYEVVGTREFWMLEKVL